MRVFLNAGDGLLLERLDRRVGNRRKDVAEVD